MFPQVRIPFSATRAVSRSFYCFLNSHMAEAVWEYSGTPYRLTVCFRENLSLESVNNMGTYFLYLP